jgi:hypothetical protein
MGLRKSGLEKEFDEYYSDGWRFFYRREGDLNPNSIRKVKDRDFRNDLTNLKSYFLMSPNGMEYSLCDETFEDINSEFDYELMGERDIAEKLYHEIRDMSFNDKSIIGRKYFNLFQRERKLEQRRLENKTGLYSTIVEKTKIISKILQAKDELAELREAQEYEKLVLKTRKK